MKKENEVTRFYNKYPYPSYRINSRKSLYSLPFQKLLLTIINKYTKTGKILDVGCGTGELTLLLALNGFYAYGIDSAEKPLAIAKANSRKLKIETYFKKANILSFRPKKNLFDVAVANGVLHHTTNPLLGFKNMLRVTKPNGLVIVVVYNKFGSLPRKILSKAGRLFGGKSIDEKVSFLKKILPGRYGKMPDAVIADAFFHPQEITFTISDIRSWFEKYNVSYLETYPSAKLTKYLPTILLEFFWMLTLKANVFIMVGKKAGV